MARLLALTLLCFGLGSAGCSEAYCQSGAKYGTQCHSINELEWQRSMVGPPPNPAPPTQSRASQPPLTQPPPPSPGCALFSPSGIYMMPQNPNVIARPPPPYVMSGACAGSRMQIVQAVR